MKHLIFLFVWLAGTATGQTPMSEAPMTGAEFDTYTLGKTLTYLQDGQAYGTEEYRPDQQVRWAFDGGECQQGNWWEPEAGMICFRYEHAPDDAQCWHFYRSGTGLRAEFVEDQPATELYSTRRSRQPLVCLGPEVGV